MTFSKTLIIATMITMTSTHAFFDFGKESYKECNFLPLKSSYKEGYRPYYDKDKKFCVVPVETDATKKQVFEDSFAVNWEAYFSKYNEELQNIADQEQALEDMRLKLSEYETYFAEVEKYMGQFRNAPPYARPVIDLQKPVAEYQKLAADITEQTEEISELIDNAVKVNPVKGKSILHHRGNDYAYFWHQGRKKFVAILPVPHGQKLKDVKKKFKKSTFLNSLSDMGSGFRNMANDVSPAMATMKNDMAQMASDMHSMRENMETMAESMPSMAQNFEVMTQFMGQMTQNVQQMNMSVMRMSGSVGKMGNQMSKPFMGMFSFMPFM